MTDQIKLFDEEDVAIEQLLSRNRLNTIQLDDMALDEEFRRTAQDLAYWNQRYTLALKAYLQAKHNSKTVWSRLYLEIRTDETAEGTKVTIEDLKSMVQVRTEYQDAELAHIEAEANKESLRRFVESAQAKKDMLQSLGAKLRSEMEGDPAIRQLHAESRRFQPR